jgi:hypothetical protein
MVVGNKENDEKKWQQPTLTCHHEFWCKSMMAQRYF